MTPLNNNNRGNNNNRRRGRGNRQGGGGNGQQLNRIDSRARGNAPQLLEKYRKLAQDAHLNGDRVQAEYYLQFADHYFRVIADTRLRQEEQRRPRDERWQEGAEEGDDTGDFSVEGDFPSFDQPSFNNRPPREERPRRDEEAAAAPAEGDSAEGETNPYEPPANPFVRDARARTGLRPRREERRPRRDADEAAEAPVGLDPASLPPAISAVRDDDAAEEAKPRRTRARRKPAGDDAGEPVESVN